MASFVIDRFEDGGFAVLEAEDGRTFPVPRDWLPEGCAEGDVLSIRPAAGEADTPGAIRLEIRRDPEATRARLEEAKAIRDRLPRGGDGDIAL
jgi:hypothetical protein